MTLAVAWGSAESVYLASDSRISKGSKSSDYGIKVVPVHIKVFEPGKEGEAPPVAFDCTYGMCFAGDFAGASVVRNFLSIALQRLQFVPTFSSVSFLNICRITFKIYSELSEKIQDEIDSDSIDFFMAGYCPEHKKIRLAKFYIDFGAQIDKCEPRFEILSCEESDSPIYYIGSGEDEFSVNLDIFEEEPLATRPFSALKRLIDSEKVNSVGGNIQAGAFDRESQFYMLGIVDRKADENGLINISYYYASVDMNTDKLDLDNGSFMVMGNYIDPYK